MPTTGSTPRAVLPPATVVAAAGGGSGGSVVRVYATPRAGRSEIAGLRDGALWVRLAAPPVDGAANAALLALLAAKLEVGKRDVRVLSGAAGRQKRVHVERLPPHEVRRKLGIADDQ